MSTLADLHDFDVWKDVQFWKQFVRKYCIVNRFRTVASILMRAPSVLALCKHRTHVPVAQSRQYYSIGYFRKEYSLSQIFWDLLYDIFGSEQLYNFSQDISELLKERKFKYFGFDCVVTHPSRSVEHRRHLSWMGIRFLAAANFLLAEISRDTSAVDFHFSLCRRGWSAKMIWSFVNSKDRRMVGGRSYCSLCQRFRVIDRNINSEIRFESGTRLAAFYTVFNHLMYEATSLDRGQS